MKSTTYTLPPGAVHGASAPLSLEAFPFGPFMVHRSILSAGIDPKRLGWVVTHAGLGQKPHTYSFEKRRHAFTFAHWLNATGIDWASTSADEICERCRRFGITRIADAERAIRAGEIVLPSEAPARA